MFPGLNPKPKCVQCEALDSMLWRNADNGPICYNCFEDNSHRNDAEPDAIDEVNGGGGVDDKNQRVRKSTRTTRYKSNKVATGGGSAGSSSTGTTLSVVSSSGNGNGASKGLPKGRSRRNMFKKVPQKTPTVTATTNCVESLFYNGSYIQVGDIVSLFDMNDDIYYAQIRGLLIDSYCEKSAFLTWLYPTTSSPSPEERFDPSSYIIGLDEDFPRKLSCLEFVMHAPSNYYHNRETPYPQPDVDDHSSSNGGGFLWTNICEGGPL